MGFASDEPRRFDDVEYSRELFADAFVDGYRAKKNQAIVAVRPDSATMAEIDKRARGDALLRAEVVESSLSRYYGLMGRAGEDLRGRFTRAEEGALIEAILSHRTEIFEPEGFVADFAGICPRLSEAYDLDGAAVMGKLSDLSEIQLAALVDAARTVLPYGSSVEFPEGVVGEDNTPWPPLF